MKVKNLKKEGKAKFKKSCVFCAESEYTTEQVKFCLKKD